MEPQPTLADQIATALARRQMYAAKTVQDNRLKGPDAEKVFLDARLDGLEDTVNLVLAEIKEMRSAL